MDRRDKLLIELVHFLARGTKEEMGLTLRETVAFLTTPIKSKRNKTALECLEKEGRQFINEVIIFVNEIEKD